MGFDPNGSDVLAGRQSKKLCNFSDSEWMCRSIVETYGEKKVNDSVTNSCGLGRLAVNCAKFDDKDSKVH